MEIEILNIRLPTEIVQWLDSLVKRGVYHSRAEAIRDFCRQHVNESSDSFKVQKNE